MDEVSQIQGISERKVEFLERLKRDCNTLGQNLESPEGFIIGGSYVFKALDSSTQAHTRNLMIDEIESAIQHIKANHEALPGILNDLRNSLDDVR